MAPLVSNQKCTTTKNVNFGVNLIFIHFRKWGCVKSHNEENSRLQTRCIFLFYKYILESDEIEKALPQILGIAPKVRSPNKKLRKYLYISWFHDMLLRKIKGSAGRRHILRWRISETIARDGAERCQATRVWRVLKILTAKCFRIVWCSVSYSHGVH